MTWDEFKAAIDTELAARSLDSSIEIWYIDVPAARHGTLHIQTRDRDDEGDEHELAVWS